MSELLACVLYTLYKPSEKNVWLKIVSTLGGLAIVSPNPALLIL